MKSTQHLVFPQELKFGFTISQQISPHDLQASEIFTASKSAQVVNSAISGLL